MATLKTSRSKLSLNDSTSKNLSIIDRAGPTSQLTRSNSGLFTDLNSIRNDIRKQVNDKFKVETSLLKQELSKSSPLKPKETRTGSFLNRSEQAAIIHNDLLNAVKGVSSQKARRSPSRENISSRLSNFNDDFWRNKASEPSKIRLSPRDKSPLDSLSRNLLTLRGSFNSFKENVRSTALTTPLSNKQSSPLRSKFGALQSSVYTGENKYFSRDLVNLSVSKTPKVGYDTREPISKLFDSIRQNHTPVSKAEGSRAVNPLSDLSQDLDRIRNQNRRELVSTPVDKILRNYPGRSSTLHTPTATDHSFTIKYERTPKTFFEDTVDIGLGAKRKPLTEAVSLPRVYELQDALTDINNHDFDNLPSNYVEDLIKLSSVIMHRIKGSTYYSKQDRF